MIYTRTDDLYFNYEYQYAFRIILRTACMYTLAYYFIQYLYIYIYTSTLKKSKF